MLPADLARRLAAHGLTLTAGERTTHGYTAHWRLDGLGVAAWFGTLAEVERWAARWLGDEKVGLMTTTIHTGDCRAILPTLPSESVQCVVTSPPYFALRNYGHPDQIGLEPTPDCLAWARQEPPCGACYVCAMRQVFALVWPVLRADGVLWLNLGDSHAQDNKWGGASGAKNENSAAGGIPRQRTTTGLPDKNLIGVPWRVALALQADGWILRSDVIWHKPNAMPESVTDRPTRAHEYVFLFSKQPRYFYDADAIKEPASKGDAGSTFTSGKTGINGQGRQQSEESRQARRDKQGDSGLQRYAGFNARWTEREPLETRNRRTVWTIPTTPYAGAHFATFPEALVELCIRAGSRPGDTVLDPFAGSGTTMRVAERLGRVGIGIELNPEYERLHAERLNGVQVELPLEAA